MTANRTALRIAALLTIFVSSLHAANAFQPGDVAQSARDFLKAEANNTPAQTPNQNRKLAALENSPNALLPQVQPEAAPAAANSQIVALIDRHAAAAGVPASFARAVVRIESNYNPRATGRAGEVGLMQIKYQTARGLGFTGTRAQLYDPDTNLRWGMKYLALAWKLGGNTHCGAVLRYQAGHGATRATAASNAYCSKVRRHMAAN